MLLLSNNKPTHRRKVISALSRMAQLNITKLLETLAFAPQRFHVLVHSLFKVLFNFPSRYLFAIGLIPVFSIRWGLPPNLSCIPKQLDSELALWFASQAHMGLAPTQGRHIQIYLDLLHSPAAPTLCHISMCSKNASV